MGDTDDVANRSHLIGPGSDDVHHLIGFHASL